MIGCSGTVQSEENKQSLTQVKPDQLHKIQSLVTVSDSLYKKSLNGDVPGIKQDLERISILISETEFAGISSIEGLHALTGSVMEATRLSNAIQINMDSVKIVTAKIRFATDALTHKHAPLWHQYYDLLTGDLQLIAEGVNINQRKDANDAFAKFILHLDTIKPALLISKQPEEVEKVESLIAYMKAQLRIQPYQVNEIRKGLQYLQVALDKLFEKNNQGTFLPLAQPENPVYWTLGIGSAIILALIYTAWQMYKGQEDVVPARKRGDRKHG